jgi:hypothetical protein
MGQLDGGKVRHEKKPKCQQRVKKSPAKVTMPAQIIARVLKKEGLIDMRVLYSCWVIFVYTKKF